MDRRLRQAGSPLQPDAGVDLAQVTGVQFVFSSSTGAAIPNGATGSVQFDWQLRDVERVDGSTPIEPTQTQTVTNSMTPSVTNPDGTVDGPPASDTYQIIPNIASVTVDKNWFADIDGDYIPDGNPSIPAQRRWPVSSTIDATNTSPFPVETVTVREPSASTPGSALEVIDITEVRLRFPDGAATASVTITCADGSVVSLQRTPPPTTVVLSRPADWTCPSGGPDDPSMLLTSIEVVYASPPGQATIGTGAVAGLDVHGTLTGNAVPGGNPFVNCADGVVVNTGNGSTSGTATGCDQIEVVARPQPSGPGTKTVDQTSLPEDTPINYTITFRNDSGADLPDVVIADPADLENLSLASQPYAYLQINSIDATCGGAPADVTLFVPDGGGGFVQVPYASATPEQINAARGFIVSPGTLANGATCTVNIEVQRRPGTPDGVTISNCYLVISGGAPVINGSAADSTACAPNVTTDPPSSAASIQKFIEPGSVARPTPGLAPQIATVKLRIANTGNTHLRSLQLTDTSAEFFGAFDFVALQGVSFPPGADLVQFDVCTTGCAADQWILGTPTATNPPPIPGGVAPADIQGIRVTFTSSDPAHDFYNLTPGSNFPGAGPCQQASVCFTVTPRDTNRITGEPVLGTYTDTVSGHGEALGNLGGGFDIPPVTADLTVTAGRPALDVDKANVGPTSIAPGQVGFFDLTVRSTGTAALPDLEISDPIPAELTFAENGVGGQPYAIQQFDVPAGTTPPGPVQFTMERDATGRVTRLIWRFPGLFHVGSVLVIRIGVTLTPGVAAGTTAVNPMGAGSSATDDFDCSDSPPDGIVDGDPFLPGRNCTSDATLITLAGASFTASKWVTGNPALGLYDAVRGIYTALDDPLCPQRVRDGVRYTHYPCVALVYPGENFTFLARLVNSGTYRAVDVRLVDLLPAPGDTGVIDPADRGTMWDVRPTMVAPPVINPPTDGSAYSATTTYTTDSPICTDDLFPPAQCPAGDWTAPFDATATGFQVYLEFTDPGLAPGGSVDITWEMTSPPDLATPADPSIAWNSFGHTELIATPNQDTQLGAVEPQKAGVGLIFGAIQVTKQVTAGEGATVPTGPFELTYSCTVTPETGDPVQVRSGTAQFGPDAPWTLTGIPANATCLVYESGTQGGISDHPVGNPLSIVVPWNQTGEPATASLTNDFPPPPPVVPPVVPAVPPGALPATGTPIRWMIGMALVLVMMGLMLTRARRLSDH